jgi:hypothetical protein
MVVSASGIGRADPFNASNASIDAATAFLVTHQLTNSTFRQRGRPQTELDAPKAVNGEQ